MSRTILPTDLQKLLASRKSILLLDVRRRNDYEADAQKLSGAAWLDPEKLAQWSTALPLDRWENRGEGQVTFRSFHEMDYP